MKTKTVWGILIRWGMISGFLYIATHLDSPFFLKFRTYGGPLTAFALGLLAAVVCINLKNRRQKTGKLIESIVFLIIVTGIGVMSVHNPVIFDGPKDRILNTPASSLWRLGRHFIVGYRDFESIERLVSRGAVGGVYITRRNVKHASAPQIKHDIARLQALQKSLGLPPLFIAADQEGGMVSRMSPPLPRLPSPAQIVEKSATLEELHERIIDFAAIKAEGLSRIGVNLNLSPVVDLKNNEIRGLKNMQSRIFDRAISEDPDITARVAAIYCKVLEKFDIIPTLKHFPGLGNVVEETHLIDGTLDHSTAYLEQNDWIPFRRVLESTNAFMMLGHVRINSVDPELPASLSEKVVTAIIRNRWNYDGVLITDDMNMGPVYGSEGGIGGSAVRALNAGVDLLLLSYNGDQYYKAMPAVLKADRRGRLNRKRIEQSGIRLDRALNGFQKNN